MPDPLERLPAPGAPATDDLASSSQPPGKLAQVVGSLNFTRIRHRRFPSAMPPYPNRRPLPPQVRGWRLLPHHPSHHTRDGLNQVPQHPMNRVRKEGDRRDRSCENDEWDVVSQGSPPPE
jgi:hypothetical protein